MAKNKKGFTSVFVFRAIGRASFGGLKNAFKYLTNGIKNYKEQMSKAKTVSEKFKVTLGALKNLGKTVFSKLASGVKDLVDTIGIGLVKALQSAFNLIKQMATEGQELAKIQYQVEAQVSAIYGDVALENFKTLTSNIQSAGVIGDEKLLTGIQYMGNYGVSTADSATLISGLADVAASKWGIDTSEENMQQLGTAVGKAIQTGTATTLKKYGLTNIDADAFKNASPSERAKIIERAINNSTMSGRNAALLNTDEGRAQNVENSIGDLQEKMGQILNKLKTKFLTRVIEPLLPMFNDLVDIIGPKIVSAVEIVGDWLEKHQERIKNFALKATHAFVRSLPDILTKIGDILTWLQETFFPTEEQEQEQRSKDNPIIQSVKDATGGYGAVGKVNRTILDVGVIATVASVIASLIKTGILKAIQSGASFFAKSVASIAKNVASPAVDVATQFWSSYNASKVAKATQTATKTTGLFARIGNLVSKISAFGAGGTIAGAFASLAGLTSIILASIGFIYGFATDWGKLSAEDVIGGVDENGHKRAAYSHYNMGEKALGTPYSTAGTTTINERGGEIMRLPTGTTIIPADKSEAMLNGNGQIQINVNIAGNVLGNKEYADDVAKTIVKRLKLAAITA